MKQLLVRKEAFVIGLVGLSLVGCASPAMNEHMIPQGEALHMAAAGSKFHQSIQKTEVTGGSETNPLWTSQVSSENFQLALQDSFKKADFFSENGPYDLKAKLVTLDQPASGMGLTVRATVDYTIREKSNNTIVFDETIDSSFTAGMYDSIYSATRLRFANEGAIRRNIELFLKKVSKI